MQLESGIYPTKHVKSQNLNQKQATLEIGHWRITLERPKSAKGLKKTFFPLLPLILQAVQAHINSYIFPAKQNHALT